MANIIKRSDIDSWYSKLNSILSKHGLNTIPIPSIQSTATAAHVTPLTDKLNSMKSDAYYKLATYSDWGEAVQGAIMRELVPTGLSFSLANIAAQIVCRNMASNSHGTNSNVINSNGTCSNGTNDDGKYSNGTRPNQTCWNGPCYNGYHGKGGNYFEPHNYGSCSNGTNSDGYNSNGACSKGSKTNGTCSQGYKSNGRKYNGSEIDANNSNSSHKN